MIHLELFDTYQRSQAESRAWGWAYKPRFWKRTSFRGCSIGIVTRENRDEMEALGPVLSRDLSKVTCPQCLVSLDKLLAEQKVKLTQKGRVSFVGRFARYRVKTMKDHYKALALSAVGV